VLLVVEVRMGKKKQDPIAGMTTVDYLARIIELKNSVDWHKQRMAEQQETIAHLRTRLEQAQRKLSEYGICYNVWRAPDAQE
jgi:phage shock protein A